MLRENGAAKAKRAATIGRVHGNGDHLAEYIRSPYFVTADREFDLSTRVYLLFDVYSTCWSVSWEMDH